MPRATHSPYAPLDPQGQEAAGEQRRAAAASVAVDAERSAGNLLVLIRDVSARLDERDRLYTERMNHARIAVEAALVAQKEAIDTALVSQKELMSTAFAASEKAIVKAEDAQRAYNTAHNDLTRKMDDQYKMMMPRTESLNMHAAHAEKFDEIKREIVLLREHHSASTGKSAGSTALWAYLVGGVGVLLAVLAFLNR